MNEFIFIIYSYLKWKASQRCIADALWDDGESGGQSRNDIANEAPQGVVLGPLQAGEGGEPELLGAQRLDMVSHKPLGSLPRQTRAVSVRDANHRVITIVVPTLAIITLVVVISSGRGAWGKERRNI